MSKSFITLRATPDLEAGLLALSKGINRPLADTIATIVVRILGPRSTRKETLAHVQRMRQLVNELERDDAPLRPVQVRVRLPDALKCEVIAQAKMYSCSRSIWLNAAIMEGLRLLREDARQELDAERAATEPTAAA